MPTNENETTEGVIAAFSTYEKTILTFLGFSDSGYEDPATVLSSVETILDGLDADETIINAGATRSGIGMVYEIAKEKGFSTTGIVSMEAKRVGIDPSPFVDDVFYVDDLIWGGFIDDGRELSPTSKAMVSVSDRLIAIGGGRVARDELLAARSMGKATEIIPADMNHARAIAKARERNDPEPTDFRGVVGTCADFRWSSPKPLKRST